MLTGTPSEGEWERILDRLTRAENDTTEAATLLDSHSDTLLISDEVKRIEAELRIVHYRLWKMRDTPSQQRKSQAS